MARHRIALARDAYTYLHLPMVAGIVLSAFALREAVARIGHDLATVPALALCGGSALYMASYVAIRWRVTRKLRSGRRQRARSSMRPAIRSRARSRLVCELA